MCLRVQLVGCLTELLRPGRRWADDARDTLFSVLVAMLADSYMEHIMMTWRVTACLDRLLQSYDRSVWTASDSSKVSPVLPGRGPGNSWSMYL